MKDFKGKVAVVTGAASGIGRGMAEVFAGVGMKVVLSDIEDRVLADTTKSLVNSGADVFAVSTDVSKADQVEELARQAVSRYGAVHVLCNNAGVGVRTGLSWTSSLNDWNWILGVNLMGVVNGLRSFLPIMIEQGADAHIVNTSSTAGLITDDNTLYSVTKFAVVALSECVYWELQRGRFKPKISVLCPGCVDTNIMASSRNRPVDLTDDLPQPASPIATAVLDWYAERLKQGENPRAIGEQVLAAIREERFYILTHPEYRPFIEQRMKDILNGNNPTFLPPLGIASLMKKLDAFVKL